MQNSVNDSNSCSTSKTSEVPPSDHLFQLFKAALKEVLTDTQIQAIAAESTPSPLTEKEAGPMLGVKPQTMAVWRTRGKGPRYIKIGRLVRYKPEDVEEYRDQHIVRTSK